MLSILDFIFLWLHIIIIVFNLFGWAWVKTRKIHLFVVAGTLFSWIILGFRYGFGYCFLTDWHWDVKYKLGETNLPASFIKYFLDTYTWIDLPARSVDIITVVFFGVAIALTIYANFRRPRSLKNKGWYLCRAVQQIYKYATTSSSAIPLEALMRIDAFLILFSLRCSISCSLVSR